MPTTTLNGLLRRRAIVVLGKGGVGKTAVSAAIALMSANRGERVLAMECDSRAPMASMFGAEHSFEPVSAAPNLSVMILEGRHSLEEYLHLVLPGRAILNAVFASRLYQYFVQAAPGLRELMMLGKLYYEVEQNPRSRAMWKRVILDAPASGQALSLLRMPEVAHATFGESIVGREANSVARMLRDESECAILQVTTPDPLSLTETLDTYSALEAMGLKVAAVVLNRRNPVPFDSEDLAGFARNQTLRRKLKTMDHLCDIARGELERAATSRRALTQLRDRLQSPIIELQDHRGLSGLDLVNALASDLSQQSESVADLPN